MRTPRLLLFPFLLLSLCGFGCEGPDGPAGVAGPSGPAGMDGRPGAPGEPGQGGRSPIFTDDGLVVTIAEAGIDADGVATATVTLTDAQGRPLDREGFFTDGTVTLSFVMAWLGTDAMDRPTFYTAYTTREQTSPITNDTTTQAASESDGVFEETSPGVYRYTFSTVMNVVDPSATHTLAIYASRDDAAANAEYHFRPDGAEVTVTREVVTDAACNRCHEQLAIHGGSRRDVLLCITCHSPQSVDPDTGNTVDMQVMIHKIHMGADLPSVQAGTPYQIIGFRQSVRDYSTLHYPQSMAKCVTCHEGADAELYRKRPGRVSCAACHDDISFDNPPPVGLRLHRGGSQPDDTQCELCHPATGGIAGITEVHARGLLDPSGPDVALELVRVISGGPGQTPTVRFRVSVDGAPRDISTEPLTTLRATFAGPTTGYAQFWQATIQGGGAAGTLSPVDAAAGEFDYTVAVEAAIPADAEGSYTVGLEGYIQPTDMPRFAAEGPVLAFAVTGTVAPRRVVVDGAKCNVCHDDLALHGDQRKNPNYCATCHNANNAGDERYARFEGSSVVIPSVDLGVMVHKIHAGEALSQQPYVLGGFPVPNADNPAGSPIDFGEVRYPGNLANCTGCHLDGTYGLPLALGVRPVLIEERVCTEPAADDADDFCTDPFWTVASSTLVPRETAVCTACHDDVTTAVHAAVNTTSDRLESCGTCHGADATWDVEVVHRAD